MEKGMKVEWVGHWHPFGAYAEEADVARAGQIHFLVHKRNEEFIVEFKTLRPDERLMVAIVKPGATLKETVDGVIGRSKGIESTGMSTSNGFSMPAIAFDLSQRYREFDSTKIENGPYAGKSIGYVGQKIQFQLGGVPESIQPKKLLPRPLPPLRTWAVTADRPFLILLMDKTSQAPLFVAWIANSELLIPAKEPQGSK